MSEFHVDDDGTITEVVDPTGACRCVIRRYPDGTWTDTGCFRHMPHSSDETATEATSPTESIDDARRLCSDILGRVQSEQRGDGLYEMVRELVWMLEALCVLHTGCTREPGP